VNIILNLFLFALCRVDVNTPGASVSHNYIPSGDASNTVTFTDTKQVKTSHAGEVMLYWTIQATSTIRTNFLFVVGSPNGK